MNLSRFTVALVMLLLFLVSVIGTSAQDGLAELEVLFTSNVRITSYTILPDSSSPSRIGFDNTERLVRIDAESYPYPAEVDQMLSHRLTDNAILFEGTEQMLNSTGSSEERRRWVWVFDRQNETFSRANRFCWDASDLTLLNIEAAWIYVADSDTGDTRLCETATGWTSEPLPAGFSWQVRPAYSTLSIPVVVSPDDEYLILFTQDDDRVRVYSYHIETQALLELGALYCSFCLEWDSVRWFGATITIWTTEGHEPIIHVYTADLEAAGSLELAITRPYYFPELYGNPPRYDYINFTTPTRVWQTECERVIYYVLSAETETTAMGPLCRLEYGAREGIGYYRDVSRGDAGIAALTRYNAATGEREILYEGEIELIEWVSPDERYAVVVLGNNDIINVLPVSAPPWTLWESPMLALVDLMNDTVILEHWTGWYWCQGPLGGPVFSWNGYISETSVEPCYAAGPTGAILLREDGSFLVIGSLEPQDSSFYADPTEFADLVTMQGDTIDRTRIAEGLLTPYSADQILSQNWDSTARTISFSLIPVDGQPPIALTNEIPVDEYQSIRLTNIYPSTRQIRFNFSRQPEFAEAWYSADVTVQIDSP
jgi:hypothetical protein